MVSEVANVCACNMLWFHILYFLHSRPLVPNAPPENVQAFISSSTAILVRWDTVPEIDRNGIVILYEVEFNQSTFSEISTSNLTTTNGSVQVVQLEGLEEYVEYSLRVRAYTSVGPGPFSIAVVNRTLEDSELIVCKHYIVNASPLGRVCIVSQFCRLLAMYYISYFVTITFSQLLLLLLMTS